MYNIVLNFLGDLGFNFSEITTFVDVIPTIFNAVILIGVLIYLLDFFKFIFAIFSPQRWQK